MIVEKIATITTKTLLLINSEPNVREVVQACLMDLGGWKVLTAGSVLEALRQAVLHPFDAIILELSRTGMDGFWALEQLRVQPTTQKIPVVLLTSRAKWLDSQLLQRYQVAGVIANSLDPVLLPEQIASVLGWDLNSEVN
jgi:CheY-like chemotaxis protein